MRSALKKAVQGVCLAAVLPCAALAGFGRFRGVYTFFAHALALLPGFPGSCVRAAYYRLTLSVCAADITIGFGSYFAHREAGIESNVSIGAYCVMGRARIGARTQIASHVQLLSGRHQHARGGDGGMQEGLFPCITVGPDCWIGAGAIVMADVGAGATVGAGAVVVKPVPGGVVAAGNPACVLSAQCASKDAAGC